VPRNAESRPGGALKRTASYCFVIVRPLTLKIVLRAASRK